MKRQYVLVAAGAVVVLLGAAVAINSVVGDPDSVTTDAAATVGQDASADSFEAARPLAPVAEGSVLATVTAPPAGTFAMADATKLGADAFYTITFSPYGYGPPQGGETLVIRISTATPMNDSAQAMDFNGRNVLVAVAPGGTDVTEGGTYTATLSFRVQGDLLAPVLKGITAAE